MIPTLFALIFVLAVAGTVFLLKTWRRIDAEIIRRKEVEGEFSLKLMGLQATLGETQRDLGKFRQTVNGDFADLLARWGHTETDFNALLEFFADEQFAASFRASVGQTFRMKLPDALKLRLGAVREG